MLVYCRHRSNILGHLGEYELNYDSDRYESMLRIIRTHEEAYVKLSNLVEDGIKTIECTLHVPGAEHESDYILDDIHDLMLSVSYKIEHGRKSVAR